MNNLVWWGLLFAWCIIIEASSPGYFFFASFACGSLAALFVVWLALPVSIQLVTFLSVTGLSFILLKRYAQWLLRKDLVKTNVYALKGKKGVVLDRIAPLSRGWIKIENETWAALPVDNETIEKDAVVQVVSNAGSHVIVKKIDQVIN